MKIIFSSILSLITVLLTIRMQDTVRIGVFNFYPGIFKDRDGQVKGLYIDTLSEMVTKGNLFSITTLSGTEIIYPITKFKNYSFPTSL